MPRSSCQPIFAPLRVLAATVLVLATPIGVLVCVSGCDDGQARRASARQRLQRQRATQSNALFDSIRNDLAALPELTPTELSPPVVILDAKSSTDGEDVLAVVTRRPEDPTGPANVLMVPRGNCRFRSVARPGDTIKYYALLDDATQRRLKEAGDIDIATFDALDLTVAQVLGEDTLLIEGGLARPNDVPLKIELWRTTDDRMEAIRRDWTAYAKRREPPLAWHPSPDDGVLEQLNERLNQWLRQSRLSGADATVDPAVWAPADAISSLPEAVSGDDELAPFLSDRELATGSFSPLDTRMIQAAQWRRDVARWARGDEAAPLSQAASLFDWVVRNVALTGGDSPAPTRWPWETMLFGEGTAADRAWLTVASCRQRNLPAAVVRVPTGESTHTLVGFADGEQLRLFDPTLGLPVPGAERGTIATLAELRGDDALCRALDLSDQRWPVTADALAEASVAIVASPFELTRRAEELQRKLVGDSAVVLSADVDAEVARLTKLAGVEADRVVLWDGPWQTLSEKLNAKPAERRRLVREFLPLAWRPKLWKARTLHFRGERQSAADNRNAAADPRDDHRQARSLYMDPRVRPRDRQLARVTAEKRDIYTTARAMATLWLANLAYDDGAPSVSLSWLDRTVWDGADATRYADALRYARARALEAAGETSEAIELLESSNGPQSHGDRLRASRLREQSAGDGASGERASDDEASDDAPSDTAAPGDKTTEPDA